ncbi:probable galacturonosyltransferase 3 isoform X2 [Ananas comosus]|uniref:Hexosyltransferase n=1 Tax=Ananas comosus TaxID=4615 RepID=A0A6P5ESC2_ANACO|nr:probable galacturonosyltransferase 3 isoform X2 [Ananas comosus]
MVVSPASDFSIARFCFWILVHSVGSEKSDTVSLSFRFGASRSQKNGKEYRKMLNCRGCNGQKNINTPSAYTDVSGSVKFHTVKSVSLSASPVRKSSHEEPEQAKNLQIKELHLERKEQRNVKLIETAEDVKLQKQETDAGRSNHYNDDIRGQYSVWRREYGNILPDTTLKLMKGQIIMAKVYASIAEKRNLTDIAGKLKNHIASSEKATKDVNSDDKLPEGAHRHAEEMGKALSAAKEVLYDCAVIAKKLRAMVPSVERSITAQKEKGMYLLQYASKTIPAALHCLALHLTTDYFSQGHSNRSTSSSNRKRLEDTSLYHYAIFSDNILATSVVINSTVVNSKEPEKHVFHIVTDKLNFAAMKMWFIAHPPPKTTIDVQSHNAFKWLNSSHCLALGRSESTLSPGDAHLKHRNPRYLSVLNHLRFYMPELFPNLDKILLLDDDVVVQRDLTPLWSMDMKGMVNGAVEICGGSFHRFDAYLNFSDPRIYGNFYPHSCIWAFGMNIFDLKAWKNKDIMGVYHYWQEQNKDCDLWKLGSLPAGLVTFYHVTYPLEKHWHLHSLGYKRNISSSDIQKAAVIHYSGSYKPWLGSGLAIPEYRKYWSKYVPFDSRYLRRCHFYL